MQLCAQWDRWATTDGSDAERMGGSWQANRNAASCGLQPGPGADDKQIRDKLRMRRNPCSVALAIYALGERGDVSAVPALESLAGTIEHRNGADD
jgi:hypothetical protein